MTAIPLTWRQVNAWRMQRHGLETRAAKSDWLDITSRLGGLHAQVMSSAELTLAARVADLTAQDVQDAIWRDRLLVKTWAYRGTLHLIPARDYPLVFGVLGTLRHFRKGAWYKYFKITADELDALMDGIRAVLTDEGITREALADAVAEHANNPALREMLRSGWGALLKPSAFSGDIAFGPNSGKNITFVKPSAWMGAWTPTPAEEAVPTMLRAFLSTYGPATIDEFDRWVGLEPRDAKAAFKQLGSDVTQVDVEGWQAWALTETCDAIASTPESQTVRLLPMFDVYTIAVAKHATYIMPEAALPKVYRPQGWISAVVVRGGRIIGTWDDSEKRGAITLTFDWFEQPDAALERAIAAEAERLSAFWGMPVTIA